jgi:hypothetical protein
MSKPIKRKQLLLMLSILCWKHSLAFFQHTMAPRPPKLSFSSRSNIVASTQYTIDELGVDREVLQKTILKHCRNLDRFLDAKPVAAHTQEAFSTVQEAVSTIGAPIILDRYGGGGMTE